MALDRIAVVGAGAWGIALANAIARTGRSVLLAARNGADVLAKTRESPRLPGVRLDDRVAVAPMGAELSGCDAILLAVRLRGRATLEWVPGWCAGCRLGFPLPTLLRMLVSRWRVSMREVIIRS